MPTLTFTDGNDSYVVATDDTYNLSFLGGDDTLTLNASGATTSADMGDDNDLVKFYDGTASILGGAGVDRFDIYGSGLVADGGMGNDRFNIRGGNGHQLAGGQGDDVFVFYADSSGISLHGGDGHDVFTDLSHSVTGTIYGDAGADSFMLFGSGVTLAGGDGNDHYRISAAGGAPDIVENANEGLDRVDVVSGYSYTLPENVENLFVGGYAGGSGADATLVGNATANKIVGASNAETMNGLDGNDKLYGNGGDDSLNGGLGRDYLDGGAGNDALHGGDGNDSLYGSGGSDLLDGGDGTDLLNGGGGDDILIAGSGGGTLIGGAGADALEGGSGKDTFKFFALSDSTVDAPDTITGFSSPDRVNLVAIDANSTLAGNQAFMVVDSSTGAAGQAWMTWDGTYTHIFTDIDGGGADMQILVAGHVNTHNDVIW